MSYTFLGSFAAALLLALILNIVDVLSFLLVAVLYLLLALLAGAGIVVVVAVVRGTLVRAGGGGPVISDRYYGLLALDERFEVERRYALKGAWRVAGAALIMFIAYAYVNDRHPQVIEDVRDWWRSQVASS